MIRTIYYKNQKGVSRTVKFDTVTGLGVKGYVYGTGQYLYGQAGYDASLHLIPLMPVYEALPKNKELPTTIWKEYPANTPESTGLCRVHFIVNGQEAIGIISFNEVAWNAFEVYEYCEALYDNKQWTRNPLYWDAVARNEAKLIQWRDMFLTNFFLCYEYKIPTNIPTTVDNELLEGKAKWRWFDRTDGGNVEIQFTPEMLIFPPQEVNDLTHPRYEKTIKGTFPMTPEARLRTIFGLNR